MRDREEGVIEDRACVTYGERQADEGGTVGTVGKLEGTEKITGKKRKMMLYWRTVDRGSVRLHIYGAVDGDRTLWKKNVRNKISHLERLKKKTEGSQI